MAQKRSTDTPDAGAAPDGVTTLADTKKQIGDPTPEELKSTTLTGPGGTKLTVPERSVERLKGMGYK